MSALSTLFEQFLRERRYLKNLIREFCSASIDAHGHSTRDIHSGS